MQRPATTPLSDTAQATGITVTNLTKTFNTDGGLVTAVDNVSLHVPEGSFFTIVGPSGCGKTTILRMLAGLETPTSGTINVSTGSDKPVTNSMVFQGDSLFPWMNVWENAAYGLKMRNAAKATIREQVGHYLNKTGLTKFAKAYPHQLSGGMRQRVSIARAFANDPDVFYMDEPFSALDEQNKTILQEELLRTWEESRKTVVFITHSVDEAVILGDEVMIMTARPGRVKKVIEVPFERPRSVLELRRQPEYGEIVYDIWASLKDEVVGAAL
ncbi:ABC transporter ATP-binding protein [Arthrobacter sp. ISL-69]|uniref:ABC transporter ATP-binding protein n=1 Tax=Arthrobacter sp. ISL-69 TaxID=2819113 RepID=UPI001BE6A700|nr:ABC transporter ATP-binding protein [Arthrobacter sp. ISL-69]MBT2535468.1 ABC transporter ATP-binding protein [Arthrobacter sp. ISL-69]